MNKTVLSILSLTAFSLLLIVITFFFGGLGFGRLFGIYGVMEYSFLGVLVVLDILIIYKVCKLYFRHPKAIMLWFGMECCSVLLWLAFICFDKIYWIGKLQTYYCKLLVWAVSQEMNEG